MAADVCKALALTNPTVALNALDEDERAKFNLGRQGEANIINEPGLYSLVLGSRKPEAKAFKEVGTELPPGVRISLTPLCGSQGIQGSWNRTGIGL